MVDAVTLGALNRIIRNNSLVYKVSGGTVDNSVIGGTTPAAITGTVVTSPKFVNSTIETATSSAVTLANNGISGIGTTLATTFVISAPQGGVNKFIYQNIASTLANVVFSGSSLVTFIAPHFPTAASSITRISWGSSLAAGCSVELEGLSATQWAVVGNNSTAITFTT